MHSIVFCHQQLIYITLLQWHHHTVAMTVTKYMQFHSLEVSHKPAKILAFNSLIVLVRDFGSTVTHSSYSAFIVELVPLHPFLSTFFLLYIPHK